MSDDGDNHGSHSAHSSADISQYKSQDARYNSLTLEDRHAAMNSLFGIKPFKSHVSKRRFEDRSGVVKQLYNVSPKKIEYSTSAGVKIGNILWSVLFGWILFTFYTITAALLWISYIGRPYSYICWKLKGYFLWPFGKYLERSYTPGNMHPVDEQKEYVEESTSLLDGGKPSVQSTSPSVTNSFAMCFYGLRNRSAGYVLWLIIAVPLLSLIHVLALAVCWMSIVFIPMAKVHIEILKLVLFGDPLTLDVVSDYPRPGAEILLYTNQALNVYYYKYTVGGMNVVLVNLLPFVLISLIFGYFVPSCPPVVVFITSLLSTIPLSYYNGMAIASISAQTSFAVGAVLNASFGSVIELILYIVSIKAGLGEVARSAMTGALLGALLLIPGLSMIIGGIKYKEQRFNPAVAGVSGVLLVIAVVGAFAPTLFYMLYGNYHLDCRECMPSGPNGALSCTNCRETQVDLDADKVYVGEARTLMFICSAVLPIAYIVGLLFTLKTHTHILHVKVEDDDEEKGEGETNPEWSKWQCIFVLIACTTMFSLISEKLVDTLEPVVESFHLTRGFVSVTILAIIPSAAEYLNAVQFALHNNMPLAVEIGASSAVQITLFQMPVLVLISAIVNHMSAANSFTLIFPMLDFYAVFFSVIILNLVYQTGKTNYFIGCSLVIIYIIIVSCFFFLP